MSDLAVPNSVDYASSASGGADEGNVKTAPIPSFESAAAANVKASAAAHPPANNSSSPAPAKKASVVQRVAGTPTTMQVHRGQPNHHPTPTPAPSSQVEAANVPRRTSWTKRDSATNSAMSSVARRRGSPAQDSAKAPAARADSESRPAGQSSVHRRREASLASSANVFHSVDRRRGSVQPGSARAGSENFAGRGASEPVTAPPFQLLSAGRPVPELPRELEDAITLYYMGQLHQLSVGDQERVVYAMVAPRDVKTVMTSLKQLEQPGATITAVVAPPPSSGHATPARSRGSGAEAHPAPKNAQQDAFAPSSRRRVLQQYQNEHHGSPLHDSTPEQKAALARFRQHFTVEACAAFLDDALDVCIARRTRCYQEQPKVAKNQGVVLPEEHLVPFYVQSVSSLLYNMTGWTQPEARRLSRVVVSIVQNWMPVVVSHTSAPQASSQPPQMAATAAATSPQAKRPPVPMVPRTNAPQPVAAA